MADLSIIIPTYKERDNLKVLVPELANFLKKEKIDYEIIVSDANSLDGTSDLIKTFSKNNPKIKLITGRSGITIRIMDGFLEAKGDVLIPVMADMSDDKKDILNLYKKMKEGDYDVVFTNRFHKNSVVIGYPKLKYIMNRLGSSLISLLFSIEYKDTSNAFKAYNKRVIKSISLENIGFGGLIELAIKSYLKGKKITEMPVNWYNRKEGKAKFKIHKSGIDYIKVVTKLAILKFFKKI